LHDLETTFSDNFWHLQNTLDSKNERLGCRTLVNSVNSITNQKIIQIKSIILQDSNLLNNSSEYVSPCYFSNDFKSLNFLNTGVL